MILGQHNKKAKLVGGLNGLKAKTGVYLNTLLGTTMCGDKTCDDLETYETTGGKTWHDIPLHDDIYLIIGDNDYIKFGLLSRYIDQYIDGISQSLESYMPKDEMYSTMSALDTSSWPDDVTKVLEVNSEGTAQARQNQTISDQSQTNQTNLTQPRTNMTNSDQPRGNQTNLGNEWIGPIKKWPALFNMQDNYGDTAFMADFTTLVTCLATSKFW